MAGTAAAQLTLGGDLVRQIAARSMFLHECLAAQGGAADLQSEDVQTRWLASLGAGGLARRLAWQRPIAPLRPEQAVASVAPDGWIELLAEALTAPPPDETRRYRYLVAGCPVAFEDLLLPFIEAARRRLRREAAAAYPLLSDAAQIALERSLLLLLSHVSLRVFHFEFTLYQNLSGRFPWVGASASNGGYRRFVRDLLAGGLPEVMREYAVLARLLALKSAEWAGTHGELLRRLQSDWPAIVCGFDLADVPCRIENIVPYRSDPHHGGRTVAIVTLPGGRRLVYKPRPVDMEEGLGELLSWANACGFSQPYRRVALLRCDGYGWVDHVAHAGCDDLCQIRAFYIRIGGLLCFAALLQGTDFHHENLIACGNQPIIVDAETLFHPRLSPDVIADLGSGARRSVEDDDFGNRLVETGFFPCGRDFDFSALGATEPIETPFRVARCDPVNSDAMGIRYETYRVARRDNVPTLNGHPETAAQHRQSVINGYGEMARLVLRNRSTLLAAIGRFVGRCGRVVARSTNTYGLLLQASLRPELMRQGAERGILFEQLRRAAVGRRQRPACWAILDAELRALERLDVPNLPNVCGQSDVCWPSALEEVVARIRHVTPASIEKEIARVAWMLSRLPMPRKEIATALA
ncbi:MAG: type 2 lanthipeptide synthetase LanM [Xanthobacteraceae bacterium]